MSMEIFYLYQQFKMTQHNIGPLNTHTSTCMHSEDDYYKPWLTVMITLTFMLIEYTIQYTQSNMKYSSTVSYPLRQSGWSIYIRFLLVKLYVNLHNHCFTWTSSKLYCMQVENSARIRVWLRQKHADAHSSEGVT